MDETSFLDHLVAHGRVATALDVLAGASGRQLEPRWVPAAAPLRRRPVAAPPPPGLRRSAPHPPLTAPLVRRARFALAQLIEDLRKGNSHVEEVWRLAPRARRTRPTHASAPQGARQPARPHGNYPTAPHRAMQTALRVAHTARSCTSPCRRCGCGRQAS